MKDIKDLTQTEKDNLYQFYIDNLDIPESYYKIAKKNFYKVILNSDIKLMPYCIVLRLYEMGYNIE